MMKQHVLLSRTRSLVAIAATAGLLFAASGRARADVVIDDFSEPSPTSQSLDYGPGPGPSPLYTPFALAPNTDGSFSSVAGGYRTMDLSGTVYTNQSVSFLAGSGNATLSTGSLSSGSASLLYDANGAGLGDLLAGLTSIEINLQSLDAGTGGGISIAVSIMDNSGLITGMQTLLQEFTDDLGATLLTFDFSTTTVDLTDLKSVSVLIDGLAGSTAYDLVLNDITAVIPQPPVPEPASIALWCLVGLVGTGYGIRRQRRVA